MTLTPGARLGRYTVRALVGRGGMGEVYHAHDPRLGRDVAIKVIASGLGADPEMRRRFDDEARLMASLDHPRICAVYDVGHDAGVDYLVMEFLEGETLASRLTRGPVPMPDLLSCAIEIASALAYAHMRHVIHRDVKPGNIFLTSGGVKVVDFGLAKLRQLGQPRHGDVGTLETQKVPARADQLIHGTPEYLSPERLQGHDDDHRADIFGFGLVLYEMATGRRAFEASSTTALVAGIMTAEPPPMVGHGTATPSFEWLVRRCLKKNPEARWQSMADVEGVLKWMAAPASTGDDIAPSRRAGWGRYAAAAVAGAAVLGLVWLTAWARSTAPPHPATPIAITVPPPEGGRFTLTSASATSAQLAVSPDGTMLASVASGADGVSRIWIRRTDSAIARPLDGTNDASYPFWSPDSRSLGFFAERQLRRIEINGGPPRPLAVAPNARGGAWSVDNVILFAPLSSSGILRVNADGSGLGEATKLEAGEATHRWPQFLPDGRHFVFFARNPDKGIRGIYLAHLDGGERTLLAPSNFDGIYAPPGRLLYVVDGTLVARTLDVSQRRLTGDPVPIVTEVGGSSNFYGAFSASVNGVLAYGRNASTGQLVWIDRAGTNAGIVADRGRYVDFQLSRDGRFLAIAQVEPHSEHSDIHVRDLARGGDSRLTSTLETDASPVWSPDGSRLVFRSNRARVHDLFITAPDRPNAEQVLLRSDKAKYPTDWHRDRRFVVYHSDNYPMGWDIWAVSADDGGAPHPLVSTRDDEVQGRISPDGRWLAYTSLSSSERPDVYATQLNGDTRRIPISVGGGSDPHWSADGRELFYLDANGMLMSVGVHTNGDLGPEKPRPLFRIPGVRVAGPFASSYDVDPSGQRFLVLVPLDDPQTLPLNMIVNWEAASSRQ